MAKIYYLNVCQIKNSISTQLRIFDLTPMCLNSSWTHPESCGDGQAYKYVGFCQFGDSAISKMTICIIRSTFKK